MQKQSKWFTGPIDSVNKWIDLFGPDGFEARIDYDDVNHPVVKGMTLWMVRTLNRAYKEQMVPLDSSPAYATEASSPSTPPPALDSSAEELGS